MDSVMVEKELRALEPLFHRSGPSASRNVFESMTSALFWEVGASGHVYDREFVLDVLEKRRADTSEELWGVHDFHVRHLADDVWLTTYELNQDGRLTRRSTIWRSTPTGWRAEYHQGTIVRVSEDQPDSR